MKLQAVLTAIALLAAAASAAPADLVGTWTSKSGGVLTGPSFYNPVEDRFVEPKLTGISYSFTTDGFFESAHYRAISNATNPTCPQAILQYQHGTYTLPPNGSIVMHPIGVDGRQQLSDPCASAHSQYTRYAQFQVMAKYETRIDDFKKIPRLNLYQFDGSPLQPLHLAYAAPLMLPTTTMNPTPAPSATSHSKRRWEVASEPLNKGAKHILRGNGPFDPAQWWDKPNVVWWAGLGMTLCGGVAYLL